MRTSLAVAVGVFAAVFLMIGLSDAEAQPAPWRITKTEWTKPDEIGYGEFLRRIAESGCTTTVSCMQSAANIYHDSDPPSFRFHADCAKWAYMLRAYYAAKNGLPFSYVRRVAGEGGDLRFGKTSNRALARHDLIDSGSGIPIALALQHLHDRVSTATFRMDPAAQDPVLQDFYSPKLQPGSIRPGTAIYDTTGHVMVVYQVTADGRILYMDAHPGESVTHGEYGAQVPQSVERLGGGFKNFRPLKLVGATRRPDGSYVGGHIVLAANDSIADYSLEQYRGNVQDAASDGPNAQFRYNNAPLDLFEFVRASMSNGSFDLNPVYELEATVATLCSDAKGGTAASGARFTNGFAALYADLSKMVELWKQGDLRIVYHGYSLKETLNDAFATEERACGATSTGVAGQIADLFQAARRLPQTDVQGLIAQMDDFRMFAEMRPVGY
jgi:hypothetical protein